MHLNKLFTRAILSDNPSEFANPISINHYRYTSALEILGKAIKSGQLGIQIVRNTPETGGVSFIQVLNWEV